MLSRAVIFHVMKDCLIEDASLILAEHYGIEEWTDPSVFRQDDVWAVGRVFPEELDPRTLSIQMGQPVNQSVYQSYLQSPERGFGGSSFTIHLLWWSDQGYSNQTISEAASYLRLSHQLGLLTGLGLNPGRITTEEFATNSLTNVLYTDNYWAQVTVVGQTAKSSWFRKLHLQALRYPKASFDYITTAPEESDRIFYKPRSERTDDGSGGKAWGRAGGEEFQRGC
ncbi:hypothetical protein BY996DRAFT_8501888 [Phakopsora pachyrhizi]|nr:hypothetical protein BY996DRAFT_8501888 [Phakopsora pachyrhizi]